MYAPVKGRPILEAMPAWRAAPPALWSVFATGLYTSDRGYGGLVGIKRLLWPGINAGAALGASATRDDDLPYGSSVHSSSGSASLFIDHMPRTGLQWMVVVTAVHTDLDITPGCPWIDGSLTASSG